MGDGVFSYDSDISSGSWDNAVKTYEGSFDGQPSAATEYDSKDCEDCGVTYTTARHSSCCLRCE